MARRKPRTDLYDLEILMDFYQRHQQVRASGCIEWTAGRHRQGYGMCGAWRKTDGVKIMTTVHRIAARLKFKRALDSSEMVIHTCSNMSCCNPDHLILGDRHDIHRIMAANHRYRPSGRQDYQLKHK
jgi:hypothetical protein